MNNSVTDTKTTAIYDSNPIVMASVFKSGTWLLRHILESLTGLNYNEPSLNNGTMDPSNPDLIEIYPNHFYSWHFIPSADIQNKLISINAKPIFLIRNIYSLAVSMYYHFANNIDHELGKGANKHEYFSGMDKDAGLHEIISGCDNKKFRWKGIGPHFYQMECMLDFSNTYPCHLISYENIVKNKIQSIQKLSQFLDVTITPNELNSLAYSSEFDTMKKVAAKSNAGSHFRLGETNSYLHELNPQHIQAIQESLSKHAPKLASLAKQAGFNELIQYDDTEAI
jgi:hypothetical protein